MRIRDFAQRHGLAVHYEQFAPQVQQESRQKWYAALRDTSPSERLAEFKDGHGLLGLFGSGVTKREALKDLAKSIQGRVMVLNAYLDDREEHKVPQALSI